METPLYFGDGAGITEIDEFDASHAEVSEELTVGTLQTSGGLAASSTSVEGDVRTQLATGRDVSVHTSLNAARLHADRFEAGTLAVDTELASPRVRSPGVLAAAGTSIVDRDLDASEARSAALTGERVDVGRALGTLEARGGVQAYYSVGEDAVFDGRVTVERECAGC